MPDANSLRRTRVLLCVMAVALTVGACTRISIEPSCPEELVVGGLGEVAANEKNPGAIATYLWEVFPPDSGTFADPSRPITTFEALREGEVVIRLTASDGLWQMISACTTRISGQAPVAVSLTADPTAAEVGATVTLTCQSVGQTTASERNITQVDGPTTELVEVSTGVAEFTPAEAGSFTFSCIGASAQGAQSPAAQVAVSVSAAPGPNGNENDNDNGGSPGGGGRRKPR